MSLFFIRVGKYCSKNDIGRIILTELEIEANIFHRKG